MVSGLTDRKKEKGAVSGSGGKMKLGRKDGEGRPKKIFICSPFRPAGCTREAKKKDMEKNIFLAKEACRYAAGKGFIPYAPHLYFPAFLSEADPDERELGILLGLTWLATCDEVWVAGLRISEGMSREISMAAGCGIPVRSYLPLTDGKDRLFDVEFCTEDELLRKLGGEE